LKAKCRPGEYLDYVSVNRNNPLLPIKLLNEAEMTLVKHAQCQHYQEELAHLQDMKSHKRPTGVKSSSAIYKLNPFIKNDVIRVGGRLEHSNLSYDAKHQILLPRDSPFTRLLLQDIHKRIGHLGKNSMLAELRQRFWIPHAGQLIKGMLSKCVDCRRYFAHPEVQHMADLPSDRVIGDLPAFSYVGVDYFGPIEVKRGRTVQKRYGVIFTCSSSRAVHLEVSHSLTTDSCIQAIRRFLARRGPVIRIRSDNGTNLVGAEAEMKRDIASWNQTKIGRYLQQHNIEWMFNPPASSHFGGFWERLIRSVRRIMFSLLRDQSISLDDEALNTLMCEVEQVLNNRPLVAASEDLYDLQTLTPNHLLLCRRNDSFPPGVFSSADSYVKRKWRQVQYLVNVFWTRWHKEYIPLLQKRQKWIKPQRNVKVGDIVLITGNTPRNVWNMGRVTEVHTDHKGLVRVVTLKTSTTVLQRPIHKLCVLLEANE
jgi:transposase InsO family protein